MTLRKKSQFVETPETLSAELVEAQQVFEEKRENVLTRVTARRESIAELLIGLNEEDRRLARLQS